MRQKSILMIGACLILMMAACGAKEEKPELPPEPTKVEKLETTATVAPTEAAEPTALPTEAPVMEPTAMPELTATPMPIETPTPEPTATSTPVPTSVPSFNISWAGGNCKMPIPEPPYAYNVKITEKAGYTNVKVTSTNGGENGDVTHTNILNYCDEMKAAGFTVDVKENVIGERYGRTCYEFSAKNADGSTVELLDDGGGVMLFVTVMAESGAQENAQTPQTSFDNSWASNEFEKLIPQPPIGESDWKTEQKDDCTYRITTYGPNLNVTVFMDYVNLLSSYGFTIEESMAEYIYIATDANGNEVKLLREADIHQYTIKKVK